MEQLKIGIVILNYLTYELTIKCLKLLNDINYKNFFVVVVDNNSPNNSYEFINDFVRKNKLIIDIEIVRSEKNGGYSYGNNLGVQMAQLRDPDYILIMNNDIEFNRNFLIDMAQFINNNKDVTMIGPGIIETKRTIEIPHRINRITAVGYILENLFFPIKLIKNIIIRKKLKNSQPIEVYSVKGCCFIINAKHFKKIGYFDDKVFLFGEEFILAEKLYQNNMSVIFTPNIRVNHNHSATITSLFDNKKILNMQLKSHKYFLDKYRKDIPKSLRKLMVCSEKIRINIYEPIIYYIKKIIK